MVIGSRHVAVFCLNMAQGLPGSFFGIGLPALLRESGAGLDVVALAYLVWAPWALKWLWGPLLEREGTPFAQIFGRVLHLPIITAGIFALLAAFPPSTLLWPIFLIGILCSFTGSTLQMVLARWIVSVEPDERCRAQLNAAQVAGMIAGAMTGGTLIVALSAWLSWTTAILAVAVLIVTTTLPFALTQSDRAGNAKDQSPAESYGWFSTRLAGFFRQPRALMLLLLMLLSDTAAGTDVFLTALLIDGGYSAATATFILNTVAMLLILPATAITGRALQTLGTRPVIIALFATKAAILAMQATDVLPFADGRAVLATSSMVVSSVIAIAYWQVYMRFSRPGHTASDIGLLTSIRTLFIMIGGVGAGQLAETLGYGGIYALAAISTLGAVAIAAMLIRNEPDIEVARP